MPIPESADSGIKPILESADSEIKAVLESATFGLMSESA